MSRTINAIAVYCGSSHGSDLAFTEAASNLGRALAQRGIKLVYGGASIGLMGTLADSCLAAGGAVHGVITAGLRDLEVAHGGLDALDVVPTMHERKATMSDAADAFIMLPGGIGTLDEFFEAISWTQLGIHEKPCGVLDVNGYYAHRELVMFEDDASALIERFLAWKPDRTAKVLGFGLAKAHDAPLSYCVRTNR